ncbi:hypothetical protein BD779DRAFT_928739 [Infundibulicybe gibba]|nr:hypothetical protein BD779DRAFT_928739 [Infundibulicybe gibba]
MPALNSGRRLARSLESSDGQRLVIGRGSPVAWAWAGGTICFLVSFIITGCTIVQACSYFSKFKMDPLLLKSAVAVIVLGSFLKFALDCWLLHSSIVLQYDTPSEDIVVPIGFSIVVAVEIIVHSTAQGTYIFRMYRFGHNRYLLAFSCVLVLIELGFGFTWVGRVAIPGATAVRLVAVLAQEIVWDITSFFTVSAFVDVFIAVSMTYQLVRSRSSGLKQTKHLIDRIIRLTIPTGMLTSSVAITIVLLWNLGKRDSFTWAGMCSLEPCCYAAGLLALLNARRKHFNVEDSGQSSMSLPTMTFSTASLASAPLSSGTATVAAAVVVPQKAMQILWQAGL